MAIPELVPIADEGSEAIAEIGVYETGLFFGGIALENGRWYAALHRFDGEGVHAGSDFRDAGADEAGGGGGERARRRLAEMAAALPGTQRQDIAVRLFTVRHAGILFGLVDTGHDSVDLVPSGLRFAPPWEGGHST